MRSPLFIRIALHYYYSYDQWTEESNAAGEVHHELAAAGLILHTPEGWVPVEEPLRLYAEALGAVPLPVNKWVMPERP